MRIKKKKNKNKKKRILKKKKPTTTTTHNKPSHVYERIHKTPLLAHSFPCGRVINNSTTECNSKTTTGTTNVWCQRRRQVFQFVISIFWLIKSHFHVVIVACVVTHQGRAVLVPLFFIRPCLLHRYNCVRDFCTNIPWGGPDRSLLIRQHETRPYSTYKVSKCFSRRRLISYLFYIHPYIKGDEKSFAHINDKWVRRFQNNLHAEL